MRQQKRNCHCPAPGGNVKTSRGRQIVYLETWARSFVGDVVYLTRLLFLLFDLF